MGIAKAILSPVGYLLFGKKKAPKPTTPMRAPPTRDALADVLARRPGVQGDQRTGQGGAESNTSPKKTVLGM